MWNPQIITNFHTCKKIAFLIGNYLNLLSIFSVCLMIHCQNPPKLNEMTIFSCFPNILKFNIKKLFSKQA